MKAIIGGKIILPDRIVEGKALLLDQKIQGIVEIGEIGDAEVIHADGLYVSPGLVDVHIHGYLGEDASDGSEEGIRKMADGIVKNGVTSWLPTTMTVSLDELRAAFAAIRRVMEKPGKGAQVLGVNAEGPYINPKRKGAQAEDHILPPTADFYLEYKDLIKLATIAPEMPGALACAQEIKRNSDIVISIGHTDATYEQAMAGFAAGFSHVTHLFNAMTPLNHRNPGVVGAALKSDAHVELIADTFHIHPELFSLVAETKKGETVLVTDCTRAGGLPDGTYTLGGQPIYVKGIECRLEDGTIAGSVLKLNESVNNMWKHTDLPLYEVVKMATLTPAKEIGANHKGALKPGYDADIIVVDDSFSVKQTIIAGESVYSA